MVVFVQKFLYSVKVVLLRQEWLSFGKSGCIWAKDIVFGQSGSVRAKVVVIG